MYVVVSEADAADKKRKADNMAEITILIHNFKTVQ